MQSKKRKKRVSLHKTERFQLCKFTIIFLSSFSILIFF